MMLLKVQSPLTNSKAMQLSKPPSRFELSVLAIDLYSDSEKLLTFATYKSGSRKRIIVLISKTLRSQVAVVVRQKVELAVSFCHSHHNSVTLSV